MTRMEVRLQGDSLEILRGRIPKYLALRRVTEQRYSKDQWPKVFVTWPHLLATSYSNQISRKRRKKNVDFHTGLSDRKILNARTPNLNLNQALI
jgi:hypothetical protein